ncbi:MAG: alpha/beta hydrolase [Candidatus Peribacteria bacterium]|jgi:predicted alpha/beta hydrolase family esterase|nr:alpha/beta hydrolase [Candidatus Peribacteria bacterium]
MPNKQNAKYKEWKIVFEKIVDKLDNNFILIGHSLGAMFIVKYLSEHTINKTIKKTLLLATPFDNADTDQLV